MWGLPSYLIDYNSMQGRHLTIVAIGDGGQIVPPPMRVIVAIEAVANQSDLLLRADFG